MLIGNVGRCGVLRSFNKAGDSDLNKAHSNARKPYPLLTPLSAHTGRLSKYSQGFRVSCEGDGLPRIVASTHGCSRVHIFLILNAESKLTQPFTASQSPLAVAQHMLISQRLCTCNSRSLFVSKHCKDGHKCNAVDKGCSKAAPPAPCDATLKPLGD